MKRVFTAPNPLIVGNLHNLIEQEGIDVILKNEFLAGGAGDLAPQDTWLEVWVVNDEDAGAAEQIVSRVTAELDTDREWICNHCQERNASSFEICWKCGADAE